MSEDMVALCVKCGEIKPVAECTQTRVIKPSLILVCVCRLCFFGDPDQNPPSLSPSGMPLTNPPEA